MIELTPEQIAHACGAAAASRARRAATAPTTCPRARSSTRARSRPGDLFVGMRGRARGRRRVRRGGDRRRAPGACSSRPSTSRRGRRRRSERGARVFEADDPLAALGGLARAWLRAAARREGCRVVGITGSTGKTSTKDILLALLAPRVRRPRARQPRELQHRDRPAADRARGRARARACWCSRWRCAAWARSASWRRSRRPRSA